MECSATSAQSYSSDHYQLQSAAPAHQRTVARVTETAAPLTATAQLCAAFANVNLIQPFSLDGSVAPSPTGASGQAAILRVVSIIKRTS